MRAARTLLALAGCLAAAAVAAEPTQPGQQAWRTEPRQQAQPTEQRQQTLVRMVRQDCGSCHGMRLTGGLGPALTPQALADKPLASLAATIVHGRPGTPMPPWRALLDEADALWIATQLQLGFPEEPQVQVQR
ncbi:MAG TPA: cytochrome c [Rubrivivax sp.]|nr:cytochrome c [Rubrivivax sp.]